jgi:hypothetical protein
MSEEYDYYMVELVKKSISEVYIKVPKGDKIEYKDHRLIAQAAKETVGKYDWDDYGWEKDIDINFIEKVDEDEAISYDVYDATGDTE